MHHLSLHPPDPQRPQEKRWRPGVPPKQPSVSVSHEAPHLLHVPVNAHGEVEIRSERLPQTGTEGGARGHTGLLEDQGAGLLTADQSDGSTGGRGMGAGLETREGGRGE